MIKYGVVVEQKKPEKVLPEKEEAESEVKKEIKEPKDD